MTNIESLFFGIGIGSTMIFLWNHFFRMVYHGIRVAGYECIRYTIAPEYRNDFSEWDKLWLIPRYFRRRFVYVFSAYWNGWEVE